MCQVFYLSNPVLRSDSRGSSRTKSQAEKHIHSETRKLCLYVFGRPLEFQIDHKPPLGLLGIQPISPPRMQHRGLTLASYSYALKHVPGEDKAIAAELSRLPVVEENPQDCYNYETICKLNFRRSAPINSQRIRQRACRGPLLSVVKHAYSGVTKTKSLARSCG